MSMGIGIGFTGPTIDTMRNTVEDTSGGGIIEIGSLLGGPLGDLTGRRLALVIASPLLLAGGLLYVYGMGLAFRTDAGSDDPRVISSTFCQWSPRWLATKGRLDEAKMTLCRLRGLPSSSRTEEILALERVAEEQIEPDGIVEKFTVIMKCKKQALIAVMIHFLTQMSGLNALAFYLTSIFMKAGLSNADFMSLIVQLVTMLTTLPASYLVETLGRRVLLLSSCLVMGIAQFLTACFFYLERDNATATSSSSPLGWLVILGVYAYQISFAWGVGPIRWILVAELFPCRARGVAASLAASANWISAFIFILALDPLVEATSLYFTFWAFAVSIWALLIFLWFVLPETKGKTFEEIQAYFHEDQSSLEPYQ
ncbi:Sugar transport protein, putative [Perkinsus marinus ATCC 50983]|uniref:Sugar transport protein, putative n=1 Tax=Perkinsus marinus (strain ATCC 50983 / TXsc) TaxID=423536 RepID=C5LNI7_PERM5|nr:Sugar transport protein, putative [Perkinsus marinus ATCC 50983]EER01738.1 Sugar transport protein, putative [Perkinsus marinus ATCC 50983]|eukprot:XP_002769020.1 Sugar transport protein, putative [Perkinsus marinus ATCC 50983]